MFLLKAFGPEENDSQLILVLYAADHGGGAGQGPGTRSLEGRL